jgi:hypothetical protein
VRFGLRLTALYRHFHVKMAAGMTAGEARDERRD